MKIRKIESRDWKFHIRKNKNGSGIGKKWKLEKEIILRGNGRDKLEKVEMKVGLEVR